MKPSLTHAGLVFLLMAHRHSVTESFSFTENQDAAKSGAGESKLMDAFGNLSPEIDQ